MNNETTIRGTSPFLSAVKEKNKVLSDTFKLLSYTLIFGGLSSWFSIAMGATHGMALVASLVALAVIWFVLPKAQNSNAGVAVAFGIAGLLGFSLGPMLNHYLGMANGSEMIISALGGTGVSFFAISAYAQKSEKDFSFLNGMIFIGMISIIVLSLLNYFFIQSSITSIGISFVVIMLMGAYMLSTVSSIIHGGEKNYISATISIYLALHNMFVSLLHLISVFTGGDD
jgi:modulator of FtsH protease